MAETSSITSIIAQKNPDGTAYEPISKLGGLGGLLGMVAALIGLLLSGNT